MFKTISPLWLIVGWLLVLSALVAASVADGARISTSLLLFVLGISPIVVMGFVANNAAPPTVAEILYRAQTRDRER
jgi:hypothetical protein